MKRRLSKTLLLAAFALCCASAARAQEPCRIERAAAPDYGGVMLGMGLEELRRMFPGSEELQKGGGSEAGASPFVASLGMLELGIRKEEFRGVEELALTFIGGRVHRIDVRFRQPVSWSGAAEFSEQASRRLAVPADSWGAVAADGTRQSRVLDCRGFSVVARVDRGGPSTLSIVDTAASKEDAGTAPPTGTQPAAPKRRPGKKHGGAASRPAQGGKGKPFEKEGH